MRVKVLQLDYWMINPKIREETISCSSLGYVPCVRIFDRPGIYKFGDKCWFETPDGLAFTYPVKDFNHDIKLIEGGFLSKIRVKALKMIIGAGIATQRQKELYYFARLAQEVRNTYRSAVMLRIKVLGK